MMKRDLETLKDLPVPAPATGAKAAALRTAMQAFTDQSQKTEDVTQDDGDATRRTHVTSNEPRRRMMRWMNSRYAIAASIAAMAVSLPAILRFIGSEPFRPASSPVPIIARKPDIGEDSRRMRVADGRSNRKPARDQIERDERPGLVSGLVDAAKEERRVVSERLRLAENKRLSVVGNVPAPPPTSGSPTARKVVATANPGASGDLHQGLRRHWRLKGSAKLDERLIARLAPADAPLRQPAYKERDKFEHTASNPVKQVAEQPVSTFSVDVDTASYSVVRRWLNQGKLPPKDAVRVEELINYFSYGYARPESASEPFKPTISVVPSPWNAETQLVHIAVKGYELKSAERPRANLVLLIDVSGSMSGQARLPLLKNAFKMLLENLQPDDTIGIVTYASGSGVALEPTKVSEKRKIIAAIDRLGAGGSTAGAQGIQDAYRLAGEVFDKDAVNRVILGTDGDFNVGITDREELKGFIERKRKSGIYLSILGVGRGNYNDALMQTLAQNGNGTAAYIDTLNEARKVLVDEASSTLFPIAKDVKIQFEFNPAVVRDYRLIGYETRALKRQDFNNDKVDAGDVGSGHAVTVIYEVTPVGAKKRLVDILRYAKPAATTTAAAVDGKAGELGFFKLRYKLPAETASRLITLPVKISEKREGIEQADEDVRFATAVAAFGQLLKGEPWIGNYSYDEVIKLANGARGKDPFGLRAEFVNLVRLAKSAQP